LQMNPGLMVLWFRGLRRSYNPTTKPR